MMMNTCLTPPPRRTHTLLPLCLHRLLFLQCRQQQARTRGLRVALRGPLRGPLGERQAARVRPVHLRVWQLLCGHVCPGPNAWPRHLLHSCRGYLCRMLRAGSQAWIGQVHVGQRRHLRRGIRQQLEARPGHIFAVAGRGEVCRRLGAGQDEWPGAVEPVRRRQLCGRLC